MKYNKSVKKGRKVSRSGLKKAMKCLFSGEHLKADQMLRSTDSMAIKDCSISEYSSQTGEGEQRIDTGDIEEAESSLREGGCLNYEEARALLGRLEYQRGNVEAALRVFDGIDINAIAPKIKISISRKAERNKLHTHWNAPPMSIHAVSLLFEAIFLKARALHDLGRFKGISWDQLKKERALYIRFYTSYLDLRSAIFTLRKFYQLNISKFEYKVHSYWYNIMVLVS